MTRPLHKTADALAEAGYHVIPLRDRQKFLQEGWGEMLERGADYCRAQLLSDAARTGAALSLAPSDPIPLFVLDIDDHQRRSLEDIWRALCPQGEEIPEGMGVCRTVNGGLHLYFQSPPGLPQNQVPKNGVDFGGGLRGDLFHSGRPRSLLVLPGSEVRRKSDGKYGSYKELRPIVPEAMPYPPESVMRRILARKSAPQAKNKDSLPTEAYHTLDLIAKISQGVIKEGEIDVTLSRIGEILGRLSPQKTPNDAILQRIFDVVAPVLQSPPFDPEDLEKQKLVRRALTSGWKTGQKNKEQYDARDKHPSVSDVLAECEMLFGGWPWIQELRRTGNAGCEIVLGVGGTSKTPHEAFVTGTLESLDDLLPVLTAISGADMDTVSCSPFHVQPGWMRALRFYLQATKTTHYLGDDPEEALVAAFRQLALTAAEDEQIFARMGDDRPDKSRHFIHWPLGQDNRAVLTIPDTAEQEHILAATGNIRIAQNWVKQKVIIKTIAGRGNKKAWCVPLRELGDEVMSTLGAAYEKVLQSRDAEVE